MSQDKEREIQLLFLEEAQEYLDTIESVLLGLESSHIDGHQMDAVLRAAHSVKGGAGMMGFVTLSQLAHRMEDSFKVLKQQRNSISIDAELESLLLSGMDRLRQVLTLNRQGADVDEQWLATVGNPVFDKLHERLGDPVADDASTMLGSDDGTNVAALLFETEVEGCLNRLESVIADPQAPCLEEELSIMAQELGGLGEMLQLEAFTQLCESILSHLEAAPDQVREIAQVSLSAWRRSQALVLVGQVGSLPTALDIKLEAPPLAHPHSTLPMETEVVEEPAFDDVFAVDFDIFSPAAQVQHPSLIEEELFDEPVVWQEATAQVSPDVQIDFSTPTEVVEEPAFDDVFAVDFDIFSPAAQVQHYKATDSVTPIAPIELSTEESSTDEVFDEQATAAQTSASLSREVQADKREVSLDDFNWQSSQPNSGKRAQPKETQENTVRIPVRQLDRLNDLFGELTIERNGLSLHLARLRNLMENLERRVSNLEQSNSRIRTAYDTVTTHSAIPTVRQPSLVTTSAPLSGGGSPPKVRFFSYFDAFDAGDSTAGRPGLGESALHLNSGFDALEMDRYNDLHLLSMEVMETIVQVQEVTSDIGLSLEETDQTARELNQTAKQLQTNLTRLRMRPLSELVGRFSRALRDLSLEYGKQAELKVLGKGTLIDRSILEALSDPLMHLVRNAFDHGIEDPFTRSSQGKPAQGVIEIKAAHRGNQTIITVSDDGNGINLNKIRARAEAMGLDAGLLAAASEDELLSLIFEPGFSTADQVTALSGRGVGMDVVRNNLKSIRGDIRVDTQPGRGTTFTLTVPYTLSVARVLLVESNGMLLAFPTDAIEEMLLLNPDQVLTTPGNEVLNWEGEMVPLTRLSSWLTFYCPRKGVATPEGVPTISVPTVLMVSQGDCLHALVCERCWGEREVAIRKVEGTLTMPPGFASCTILGDGKVVPLVDANALLRWVAQEAASTSTLVIDESARVSSSPNPLALKESRDGADNPPATPLPHSQKDSILVVDDSINVRRFLALALEKAGYLVEQAKDGQDAVEKLLGGLQVSAVICDIEMPRLDGYGFLARIKSDPVLQQLPIAMLTSRSGEKHRQLAMTLGAAAYFSKPYNERELLRTMKQLITSRVSYSPRPT
ncbi:MAG: response regulator [Symplocastrum torsivum CPER-KK1]|jgi:chemosensory pili system protein ChpA (sensor histidine kinase/response regulator)|uniref:histidine kinase n=1 Tax=Symplocastrum torsivum CPER-KK1 TaxID=450513 RepID=A0A951PRK3_9CYAN|nr:response regulator [Symplocastrum torsivum CPER-KK1]